MNWFVTVVVTLGLSMTGDMITSCKVPRSFHTESNPLLGNSPTCTRLVLELGAIDGAIVYGSWRLRKHGGKLGKLWPAGMLVQTYAHAQGINHNIPLDFRHGVNFICPGNGAGCK